MSPLYHIRLLSYDERERVFSPLPAFYTTDDDDQDGQSQRIVTIEEAKERGTFPSDYFMNMYRTWNNFTRVGHPVFHHSKELANFNRMGNELVERLRKEQLPNVCVEPYQSLYTSLELGNCVSGWWHVKDCVYGCIIPVQQLPISDELKGKLMAWRCHKSKNWLDDDFLLAVKEEGRDLEEHLLWELNVSDILRGELEKEREKLRQNGKRDM